ncbi:hypothetical protein [Streptomyces sp. NPDC021224]|uniref:hypothetical protein n=1 Tax=unclassified Streptomyces TaxID=2593676 RepID=UPI0037909B40
MSTPPPPLQVIPPLLDPTLTFDGRPGERTADLNTAFWQRLCAPGAVLAHAVRLDSPQAEEGAAGAGPDRGTACLLALAAADTLGEPAGSAAHLLGLAAAARVRGAGDAGLTVAVDDVHLVTGTTQSSADVARAAALSTLMLPEVEAGAALLRAAGPGVRVILHADQQLPAVLGILGRAPACAPVLTGAFVRDHAAALRRVPALAGARLLPEAPELPGARIGGLVPAGRDASRGAVWVTEPDSVPAAGPWAGWLDAAGAAGLGPGRRERCAGLVVTVARLDGWGRAWDAAGGPYDLRHAAVLGRRVPVALDLLAGAPGVTYEDLDRAVALAAGSGVRIAGCRPFRLAAGHPGGAWAGVPVHTAAEPGHDLARWAASATAPDTAAGPWLDRLARRHPLFPGRLAAALFAADGHPADGGTSWNPAVRQVRTRHAAPPGTAPGDFLVDLRTGRMNRLSVPLAALTTALRRGGPAASGALRRLPGPRRAALLAALRTAGALLPDGRPTDAA